MKNKIKFLIGLAIGFSCGVEAGRETTSFNEGWRFARFGAMPDGTQLGEPKGLEKVAADDADWRLLNLPHDWGIEGPFRDDLPNGTGKLPWAGIGWYRKTFQSLEADQGKRVFVEFDGAMSNSKVWLNGEYVGEWPYGYASFQLELTKHLKVGQENVIAVRLDNKADSSRWYPGGGIYRNVRLVKTAPLHVAHWGTFVTTPQVSKSKATVQIATTVRNQSDKKTGMDVRHEIFNAQEVKVAGTTLKNAPLESACTLTVKKPKLWDLESPVLYRVETAILVDGTVVDEYETVFGIRTIKYIADQGFLLNGKVVKLKGVCQHHDLGPLGSAVHLRAVERQIEILQKMGCNAIRTSHNPPAPELLDACDRMGMLVQVEAFDCWEKGKRPNDYHLHFPEWHEKDLRAMIHRDRNHPSVIMWSTGNEVREQATPEGHKVSTHLTEIIHSEDRTRPVTAGASYPKAGTNGFQKTVDVFGYNYKPHLYGKVREVNPDLPIYGSETASCISSRGEYFFPVMDNKNKGVGGRFHVSSYDLYAPGWASKPDVEFEGQDRHPFVGGEFVWTGFDYIGEPTPFNKDKTNLLNFADPAEKKKMEEELKKMKGGIPPRSSYFGIIDLCGFPKDRFYLYQSRWRPELPMAHILPHWNWPERIGEITPVHVYTSGDEAELFLNGKSLGRKKKGEYEYRLRWDEVEYQPGTLKVVAYKKGRKWAEATMKTTGAAKKIGLSADRSEIRADGADLSFVTVQILDKDGHLVPRTDNLVEFTLSGPGEIIAVGNGNPTSHESFQAPRRKAFNGLGLVVIRSKKGETGTIRLHAKSTGLRSLELAISAQYKQEEIRCE
ncbi:MAG: DUF4982 domain-containing protein [Verrucomicrobia bacterium]|nr:DUF4982 domain-containing protein [Verrucomicrobiota bacterium]